MQRRKGCGEGWGEGGSGILPSPYEAKQKHNPSNTVLIHHDPGAESRCGPRGGTGDWPHDTGGRGGGTADGRRVPAGGRRRKYVGRWVCDCEGLGKGAYRHALGLEVWAGGSELGAGD